MATKSKPAAKKTAARKHVPVHKPAAHKPAVSKHKVEHKPAPRPPTKASSHPPAPAKPQPKPAAPHRPAAESVSLIDKKHPEKKSAEGEAKKKTAVLPPISRIRASLEAPTAPPKKAEPAPAPTPTETPKTEPAVAEEE